MKKTLAILLRTILGILAAIALCAAVLVGIWLVRREDPASFLPDRYIAYLQVPSLRLVYDRWLNLEAADVVLARPDLAPYHRVVSTLRGLSLTGSPVLRSLMEVRADIVLLKDRKLLAVVDLGWRGIFTPLARCVGPLLAVRGFSFLNDSGVPMYLYRTGDTTIHAALAGNVAVVSLDAEVVKEALARRASQTGLAARASRELLDRIKLRSRSALRILIDTHGLSADLLSTSTAGARILDAVEIPGQSMVDVELSDTRLKLGADLPVSISMPELAKTVAARPSPIGVLRYVPSAASLLSVSNIARLADLYRLAAAFQGKDVQDLYARADAGARSVVGAGIDQLLLSWIGAEMGVFQLPESGEPVFFARITDQGACARAIATLTASVVAGKDTSLVLDGTRIDRLSIPWYVGLVLDTVGVNLPEPYFITRGDYFFLSLDAQNLAAVAKAADTGANLAQAGLFTSLMQGTPADPAFLVWYDITRVQPFFLRGEGLLTDILHLYPSVLAAVRLSPAEVKVSLAAARTAGGGVKLLPGFPVSPDGGVSGDVLAFPFAGSVAPFLAWVTTRGTLVLADQTGAKTAETQLEPDSVLVAERDESGFVASLWAVSPGGTVWRFGPRLEPRPAFPVATGLSSTMPPTIIGGSLALFSRQDSAIVLVGPDGTRTTLPQRLDAPLYEPPDFRAGRLAFYPRSFDSRVHLSDRSGNEAPGWPVRASGISSCSPRIVAVGQSFLVTFLTQAGELHAWDLSGAETAPFPLTLPGVYYATPQPTVAEGKQALVALAQDGTLSLVGLDGTVLRRAAVPGLDGKSARILMADIDGSGAEEILLYGSGAFIEGYDSSLRPLPGFPVKGLSRPQLADIDRDGRPDFVTAGIDGKIYAYATARSHK
jgi:hypothetical protein